MAAPAIAARVGIGHAAAVQSPWVGRGAVGAGLAGISAACVLALLPMTGNGVTGNAVHPHYGDFGWSAYAPVPDNPTAADLRAAGVRLPQDRVARRRQVAATAGALGVALCAGGAAARRRRRE